MSTKISRDELLITLEYLLEHTDEEHPAFHKDIIDFAQQNYGIAFRRQRVGPLLKYLMDVTSRYPEKFPFVLEEKPTEQNERYYISQRQFTDHEIISIVHAIKSDIYTDDKESDDLVKRFLELTTNEFKRNEIRDDLGKEIKGIQKYPKSMLINIKKLQSAAHDRAFVSFTLPSDQVPITPNKVQKHSEETTITGYVYQVVENNHKPCALFVNVVTKKLVSYPISIMKNISVVPLYDSAEEAPDINKIFKHPEYRNIEDYIGNEVMTDFSIIRVLPVQFRFRYNENNFEAISFSFKDFFKKPMPFERVNLFLHKFSEKPSDKKLVPEKISDADLTIPYVIVSTEIDVYSFIQWASSFEISTVIEVTGSESVVQRLVALYRHNFNRTARFDPDFEWRIFYREREIKPKK